MIILTTMLMFHVVVFFFFNATATTEIYTLSLHDALPIWVTPKVPWSTKRAFTLEVITASLLREPIELTGPITTSLTTLRTLALESAMRVSSSLVAWSEASPASSTTRLKDTTFTWTRSPKRLLIWSSIFHSKVSSST